MSGFIIWLLLVVIPGMKVIFVLIFLASLVYLIMWLHEITTKHAPESDEYKEGDRLVQKYWPYGAAFFLLLVCLTVITPTREDMVLIVSGHYATNIEGINKLSPNLVKYFNKYLEEADE